jgi:hypothetical protein
MKIIHRCGLAAIISLSLFPLGQRSDTFQTSFASGNIFEPQRRDLNLENMRTTSAFAKVLSAAGTPGGIAAVTGCDQEATYMFPMSGASLRARLDGIVSTDPRYGWRFGHGVVNISPRSGDPALLSLRVSKVKVRAARSLSEAVNQLFAIPAVQNRMTELHLSSGPTRTGIGDLKRPNSGGGNDGRLYSLSLRNVTVREALNAIVRAHGKAVWAYLERRCNGSAEFQIQFLVS